MQYSNNLISIYSVDEKVKLLIVPFDEFDDQDDDEIYDINDFCYLVPDADSQIDTDLDRLGDSCDDDDDNDGVPDAFENQNGMDPLDPQDILRDPDEDFLPNIYEYEAGTDPQNRASTPEHFSDFYDSFEGSFDSKWEMSAGSGEWVVSDNKSIDGSFSLLAPVQDLNRYATAVLQGYFLEGELEFSFLLDESDFSTLFKAYVIGAGKSFVEVTDTNGQWQNVKQKISRGYHTIVILTGTGSKGIFGESAPSAYIDNVKFTAYKPAVPDRDGDGYLNDEDAFINDHNEWVDSDNDLIGNNADEDDDNDGVLDKDDLFPLDSSETVDSDNDGVGDNSDKCLNTPDPQQLDSNNNGVGNACDDTDVFPVDDADPESDLTDYFVINPELLWYYNLDEEGVYLPLGKGKYTETLQDNLFSEGGAVYLKGISASQRYFNTMPSIWAFADVIFDEPVKILSAEHMSGQVITNKGNVSAVFSVGATGADTDTYEIKTQYVGIEAVQTPVGNFNSIHLKFELDLSVDFNSGSYSTYDIRLDRKVDLWLVKGIGVVKWKYTSSDTSFDLFDTSFAIKETGYGDVDYDGVVNKIDQFPNDSLESIDTDLDGTGNNADDDDDNDGVSDSADSFPLDPFETTDTDHDGIGNNADTDDDNDGVEDEEDAFPIDASETTDTDHDGIGNNADTDDDDDGVEDEEDAFPIDASETTDTDHDGIGDNKDTGTDSHDIQNQNSQSSGGGGTTGLVLLTLIGFAFLVRKKEKR